MHRHSNRYNRAIMVALGLVLLCSILIISSITSPSNAARMPTATPTVPTAASDADAELQFQCPGAMLVQAEGVADTDDLMANTGQSEAATIAAIASLLTTGGTPDTSRTTDIANQNQLFLPLILRSPNIRFQLLTRDGITERTGRAGTTVVYPLRLVNQGDTISSLSLDFQSRCGGTGGIPGCIDSYDAASFTNIGPNEGRDFNLIVTIPANASAGVAGLTEVVATARAALNTTVTQIIGLRTTVSPQPTVTPAPTSTPRNDDDSPDISIQITPSSATVAAGGNRIYDLRVRNTGGSTSTRIELEIPLNRDLVRLLDTSLPGNDNGDWVRDAGDSSGTIKIRFNNLRRNQERRYQICFQTFSSRTGIYEERGSFNWAERSGDDRRTNRFRLEIRQQQVAALSGQQVVWSWLETDATGNAPDTARRFTGADFQPGETVHLWVAGPDGIEQLDLTVIASDTGQIVIDPLDLDLSAPSGYLLAYGSESLRVRVAEID